MPGVAQTVLVSHRACTRCGAPYRNDFARCPVDGAEIADLDEDPLIGSVVAHYQIERLVGEGGMGRVYSARHVRLSHRRVALKVMLGELAATLATRLRFTQEAEAASGLDHPNVVSVVDFGRTQDGLMYLAMELVEGRPLSALIDEGPLAVDRALPLFRQMCAGLAHAHERGFVHRDFKPDNVMVVESSAGEVARIVDFGLAIVADPASDAPRVTTVGLALGTPAYAAPEQVRGDPVDHRADLFALGVTMFEVLAGVPPVVGTVRELIERHARGVVPAIAERAPGVEVPPALEALVRRLMAPDPDARPQSIAEVLATLDQPLAPPTVAPPIAEVVPAAPALPRRRTGRRLAVLGATVALGTALWIMFSRSAGPAQGRIDAAAIAAPSASPPLPVEPVVATAPPPPPVIERSPLDGSAAASPPPAGATPAERPVRRRPAPAARQAQVASTVAAVTLEAPPVEVVPVPREDLRPPAEPIAPVVPPAPVAPPPPPPPPPAVIATRASARLGSITVTGSLTSGTVKRAVDRALPAVAACYGEAARRAARSPQVEVGVRLTIDENRTAHGIRVTAPALPGVSTCVAEALSSVRTDTAPDVGTVGVAFAIRLIPESP